MCLQPVGTEAAVGHEGYGKVDGVLHLLKNDGLYPTLLFR